MKQEIKERIKKIRKGEVPEGYKRSSVGIIPKDWEVILLRDASLDKPQYGINAPAVKYDESLPKYLRITDIDEYGRYIKSNKVSVEIKEYKNYILGEDDIVFARTGSTTGKSYLYDKKDGELVFAGFLIKFRINKDIMSSKFVKLFTDSYIYKKWVETISARSGQPGINSEEFSKLNLPKPFYLEQQKIAQILSTWDKAIELKEKLLNEKKEYKKGLMQNLLTGKIRLPGFEGQWEKKHIGEVLDFIKKEPIKNPQDYYLLTVKLHVKGIEATNKKPNLTEKGRPYYLREPNELLIGRQNFHNGGIGIVPEGMKGYVASNAISSLYVKKGILKFYFYYLSNERFYKKIDNMIGGTGQKEISEMMIKKLKIVVPQTVEEQQAIVDILSTADKEIELLEKELEELKEQKRGLMQLLLTGIVRVN